MRTRVNDAVHVQIEVIELHLVRVGFAGIDWNLDTIALFSLQMPSKQVFQYLVREVSQITNRGVNVQAHQSLVFSMAVEKNESNELPTELPVDVCLVCLYY